MTGFISRIISRHAHPQNNIVPRLPGRFESAAGVTQNLFENDFGNSDIGSTANPDNIGNNRHIRHTQDKAHESIDPANEDNSAVLLDKNKASAVKVSNTNLQTPSIPKPAAINKLERSVMPNEDVLVHQTIIPKLSTADNEHNSNTTVNDTPSHNYNIQEMNIIDNAAISAGSLQFIAPVTSKERSIKESTSLQIQQPLSATPSLQPNITAPLISERANQQPVIKVHIGKIEIKAINQPSANEVRTKSSNANKPAMTLDDYLKKRNAR